jgi:hypothetical protein
MSNIDKIVIGMKNCPKWTKTRTHSKQKRKARRAYRREANRNFDNIPKPKLTDWDIW